MASDLYLTSAITLEAYAADPQLCADGTTNIRTNLCTDSVHLPVTDPPSMLDDQGFSANALIQTTRGRIPASEVTLDDRVVSPIGLVRITGVSRRIAASAIVISNGTDTLHVARGQLLLCNHWVCKALIDLESAVVPATSLRRGASVVIPSGGVDLINLTLDCSCVVDVQGFHLAVPRAEAIAGHDWDDLRAPVSIAPGMHLADPSSCSQLDQAGSILRVRSNHNSRRVSE